MRITLISLVLAAFVSASAAQDPKPSGTTPPVRTETPKVESPKAETPKGEAPRAESPKPQGPKGAEPAKQDPAKGGPGVDPKAGDPKKDDPKKGGGDEDPVVVDQPKDQPLPQSGDPADLRAMRSAQEMVAAEQRLRARIKAGKIKDIDKLLSFEEISAWPYEDGLKGMPKGVKELDGKQVAMIGFMLPIDEVENIKEFLLVQSLWACCYGQPPDINGIVRVVMKGDKRCDYQFDPIMVTGKFKVEATLEDGYCIDIYQLEATAVSQLK